MDDNLFQRLLSRIQRSFGRGRVALTDDSGAVQKIQGKFNNEETLDNLLHFAHFGLSSNAPPESDFLAVFLNGDRGNGVVLGTNHPDSRPKNLAIGESALFNLVGVKIYLSKGGLVIEGAGLPITVNNTPTVTVNAGTKVQMNTPELNVSGKITAGGDITDNSGSGGQAMATMRARYNAHEHSVSNVQGGSSTISSEQPQPRM